jgi:hypothetical protein
LASNLYPSDLHFLRAGITDMSYCTLLLNNYFSGLLSTRASIVRAERWIDTSSPVSGAFFTKVVDLGASSLKLEIWDTAGQEKYHSVCHLYFRGANAALLVYDITQKVGPTSRVFPASFPGRHLCSGAVLLPSKG